MINGSISFSFKHTASRRSGQARHAQGSAAQLARGAGGGQGADERARGNPVVNEILTWEKEALNAWRDEDASRKNDAPGAVLFFTC